MLAEAAAGRLETLATELEQLAQRGAGAGGNHRAVARVAARRRRAPRARVGQSGCRRAARARRGAARGAGARTGGRRARSRSRTTCDGFTSCAGRSRRWPPPSRSRSRRAIGRCATLRRRSTTAHRSRRRRIARRSRRGSRRPRTALGPRVQELRDADEWQRWANLQVQEELCREMDALKAVADLEAAARRMRELQTRWKQVALAPRAQGEVMWRRFKAAQDEVFGRTAAHFAAQNEERAANLARKQALCERAGALSDVERLGPHRDRDPGAAGRVEDDRPRHAADTRRRSGSSSAAPATASSRAGRKT